MNKQGWVDRYIYAATKDLPKKQRADVEQELRGLIEDMLEARCGGAEPAEADVQAVLEELGDPATLASQYAPEANGVLIGPPYYAKYRFMLQLVLWAVGLSMALVFVLHIFTTPDSVWQNLSDSISSLISALAFGFTTVTLLYAGMQRRGIQLGKEAFSLKSLPEVPVQQVVIKRSGTVVSIVLSVIFTAVLLFAPGVIVFVHKGVAAPLFNIPLLQSRAVFLLLIFLFGVTKAGFDLYEGRHTIRRAIVALVLDAASLAALALLMRGPIISAEFLNVISTVVDADAVHQVFGNLNHLIVGVAVLGFALSCGESFYKAIRYGR